MKDLFKKTLSPLTKPYIPPIDSWSKAIIKEVDDNKINYIDQEIVDDIADLKRQLRDIEVIVCRLWKKQRELE